MPALLIPLLKYLIPGLLVAGLVYYGGYKAYDNGRSVERAVWQEKFLKEETAAKEALLLAQAAAHYQEEQHRKQLEELTDAKKRAIKNLKSDIASLSRRGLYIEATSCPDIGAGETESTGQSSGGTGRVRLPQQAEGDLISLAEDAQQVVIQYQACREELLSLVEVLPDN